MSSKTSNLPDQNGFYGKYGGKFVPETLMYALEQLEDTYKNLKDTKHKEVKIKKHKLNML